MGSCPDTDIDPYSKANSLSGSNSKSTFRNNFAPNNFFRVNFAYKPKKRENLSATIKLLDSTLG